MAEDKVWLLLSEILGCLCLEVGGSPGGPTCYCGLVPAQSVPMDFCTCADAGSCGMAWVRLDGVFPSSLFPQPDQTARACTAPLAVRVQIGVTRCLPGLDSKGNPPNEALQMDAVRVQIGDMTAMRRALDCCLLKPRRDWILGQYVPIGPAGDCGGGAFTVTVRLL